MEYCWFTVAGRVDGLQPHERGHGWAFDLAKSRTGASLDSRYFALFHASRFLYRVNHSRDCLVSLGFRFFPFCNSWVWPKQKSQAFELFLGWAPWPWRSLGACCRSRGWWNGSHWELDQVLSCSSLLVYLSYSLGLAGGIFAQWFIPRHMHLSGLTF